MNSVIKYFLSTELFWVRDHDREQVTGHDTGYDQVMIQAMMYIQLVRKSVRKSVRKYASTQIERLPTMSPTKWVEAVSWQ